MEQSPIKVSVAALEERDPSAPVLLYGDFEGSIRRAAQLGFDAIELHIRDPKLFSGAKLSRTCADTNMEISGIATGLSNAEDGLSLISDSAENRIVAVDRLKDFVDLGREVNAAILIGRMKDRIQDAAKLAHYEDLLADSLIRVGAYAQSYGVAIMLEAINRYESNYDYTISSIADLITRYRIPATRVLMDAFHMNIEEVDLQGIVETHFDQLGYFHFADSNRMYAGAGHTDLAGLYRKLHQMGYAGYIGIECLPIPDGDEAARRSLKFIRDLQQSIAME